jgi:hypothetical protein
MLRTDGHRRALLALPVLVLVGYHFELVYTAIHVNCCSRKQCKHIGSGCPRIPSREATIGNGFGVLTPLKRDTGSRKARRDESRACGFADPYASWQRGTNGPLRQFFPKRTDFTQIGHREVARVERLGNERPRRRLDYRTRCEILTKHLCRN